MLKKDLRKISPISNDLTNTKTNFNVQNTQNLEKIYDAKINYRYFKFGAHAYRI